MADVINFYSTADAYGEFSNFAPYPIRLGGKVWPTAYPTEGAGRTNSYGPVEGPS